MPDAKLAVGVDLGGTSLRAGVVDAGGEVKAEASTKTRPAEGLDAVLERLVGIVREAVEEAGTALDAVAGVGIGVPGGVDTPRGHVHLAPNLGWEDLTLGPRLADELGVAVTLDNDVNVAILGEHRFGAARGVDDAIGVWVGTGIGGGVIARGQVLRGVHGAAAELGHTIVLADGPTCGCGNRGCVEALASRTAIEAEIRRRISRGDPCVVPDILARSGKERVTSGVLKKALGKGDEVVAQVLARAQRYLGIGIANWINVLDPALVVLGGGVVEKLGATFLEPVEREARHHVFKTRGDPVRFVEGELGDWSGVLGAAALVL